VRRGAGFALTAQTTAVTIQDGGRKAEGSRQAAHLTTLPSLLAPGNTRRQPLATLSVARSLLAKAATIESDKDGSAT
jgi:hypothetical protein